MGNEIFLVQDIVYYDVIKTEGGNKYKYLNIVDLPIDNADMEALKEQLVDIHKVVVKAGHTMNLEGMSILNLHSYPGVQLNTIVEQLAPKYISFWGANPQKIGLNILPMKGMVWNGIKILRLDNVDQTLNDANLKSKTEQYLKFLFGIK